MTTDVWRDEDSEKIKTKGLFRLSVDVDGQVQVRDFLHQLVFSGRMHDILLFFERTHKYPPKDVNKTHETYSHPCDEGTLGKASDFFSRLSSDDTLGLWALLCLHKNTSPDARRELLFSWPRQDFRQQFSLEKNGGVAFSGCVIDFVMGGVFQKGIELHTSEPNRLSSTNPRLFFHYQFKSNYHNDFGNTFVKKTSVEEFIGLSCPAFLDVLTKDPGKVNKKFHVFFETEETCEELLKSSDFMTYWKREGARDNGGLVLGSLINSSLGVRQKQQVAKRLFHEIKREDVLASWKSVDIFPLQKKGLFRSWFSVGAGCGLSQNDIVQHAGFSMASALAGRMKYAEEWIRYLPLFLKNGAFENDKEHILLSYWKEISGTSALYTKSDNLISSINLGLSALYDHGIMPKDFRFDAFLKQMEDFAEQFRNDSDDYSAERQKMTDAGSAMIERFLMARHLEPTTETKPQKMMRKM